MKFNLLHMNLFKPIEKAYKTAKYKGWDSIYWAIDLHGTIVKSNYKRNNNLEYYPYAKEVLKLLSSKKHIKLILFTCSYEEDCKKLIEKLKEEKIFFNFINENPEAADTEYGCYRKKFYFNVLIEDKSGFEPEKDWEEIYYYLNENLNNFERNIK